MISIIKSDFLYIYRNYLGFIFKYYNNFKWYTYQVFFLYLIYNNIISTRIKSTIKYINFVV